MLTKLGSREKRVTLTKLGIIQWLMSANKLMYRAEVKRREVNYRKTDRITVSLNDTVFFVTRIRLRDVYFSFHGILYNFVIFKSVLIPEKKGIEKIESVSNKVREFEKRWTMRKWEIIRWLMLANNAKRSPILPPVLIKKKDRDAFFSVLFLCHSFMPIPHHSLLVSPL